MRAPEPIVVAYLFPEILDELVHLLTGLADEAWIRPTVCSGWSVKDVALHLLGDDVGLLSRQRDRFSFTDKDLSGWDDLVAFINQLNETWVAATRRMSPQVLCHLLRITGEQVCDYVQSLDPYAIGGPVSWAGPEPAPIWLDLAREYTERWHHQQQIREAVEKPGLTSARWFAPVLDAFVRALPHTYRDERANPGTLIRLSIEGEAGGTWDLVREEDGWQLYLEGSDVAAAHVVIAQDVAWRVFTKGISPHEAEASAAISGDVALGQRVLSMISILA